MVEFSFDGGKYDLEDLPEIHPVDITEILKQSRYRYVLDLSKGTVVMKHITKRMKDHIDSLKYMTFPDAKEVEEEIAILYPESLAEGRTEEVEKRLKELALRLRPMMDLYALGCIEYPFLSTRQDLDVFLESLQPEEQEAIRQMLLILTTWDTPIDYTKLEIAERFHIQLVTMEHITEPTYMQFLALKSVIEQEHAQTERMYKEMGVLK